MKLTFKTTIEVADDTHYLLRIDGADGRCIKHVTSFAALVDELRSWLPIYPVFDASQHTPAAPPSTLAPEPITNRPVDDPLHTPSRFQIGDAVYVTGTVTGVLFREGEVNYEVAVGTTDELGEQCVVVRSYDARPRTMEHIGGMWR